MEAKEAKQDFYSKTGFAVFLFTIAASVLWASYFTVFHNSVDLGELEAGPPLPKLAAGGKGGSSAARAKEASGKGADQTPDQIKAQAANQEESDSSGGEAKPWLSTSQSIAQGAKVYKIHCAVCHGAKGLGDGTPGLVPPPRNLVEGEWKHGGSSKELFITLRKGIEGTSMVSFKHLSKEERWTLVHYIRSITKSKANDDLEELEEFAKTAL